MKKHKPMTESEKRRRKHLRFQKALAKLLQLPLPPRSLMD